MKLCKFCALIGLMVISICTFSATGEQKCVDKRFGLNCYFECNCLKSNCAENGTCTGTSCKDGFYGPICQKRNIVLHSKNVTQSPYETSNATYAVDGNKTTYSETFGTRPYLYVDYGSHTKAESIRVDYLNRESMKICFTDNIDNIEDRTEFEKHVKTCYYRYRSPFTRNSNPTSRYVVVYPSKRSSSSLMISEIEVKKNLIVTGHPQINPSKAGANQSPKLAIDGDKYTFVETKGNNCTLMVDLGKFCNFTNLKVKLRRNYGSYEVYISNKTDVYDGLADNTSMKYVNKFRSSSSYTWTIPIGSQITGRYIILRRTGYGTLKVYEITAIERAIPLSVKQSPYDHHYPAALAFDGREQTYAQTYGRDPYLAVDLLNVSTISSISLDIELKEKDYEICVSNTSDVFKHGNIMASSSDRCWNKTELNSTWELYQPGSARYVSLSSPDDGFLTLKELQVFACIRGTYGEDCEFQCDRCKNYSCDGITGKCLNGCGYGWFGSNCSTACPSHCICNGSFNKCDSCESGWFGDLCDTKCPTNCSQGCDQQTGGCVNCTTGTYGDNCTESCSDKCNTKTGCDRKSGTCVECKNGFYGNKCKNTCPSACAGQRCNRQTGDCYNCSIGYYGKTCAIKCPTNCNAQGCEKDTGFCKACMLGFAGATCMIPCDKTSDSCLKCTKDANCEFSCPQTCKENKCNESTGVCYSCNIGYSGAICDKKCSKQCSKVGCYQNESCIDCINGFYGINCSLTCSKNCQNQSCDQNTGHCKTCKEGYFGKFCSYSCPSNCGNAGCNKESRLCLSCKAGYYGNVCNKACPTNCDGHGCDISSGKCFTCKMGYYGAMCNKSCSKNCDKFNCVMDTGFCYECKNGYFGATCNTSCPYACGINGCSKSKGICNNCKKGYYGTNCEQPCSGNCVNSECIKSSGECIKCKYNYYGASCDRSCPKNCNYLGCNSKTGDCSQCIEGFFGKKCNSTCPVNCDSRGCSQTKSDCKKCRISYYGDKCNIKCPRTCMGNECLQKSGECTSCLSGYYGNKCNTRCPENCDSKICDITSGNCLGCKNGFHGDKCSNLCSDDCSDKGCMMATGVCWAKKKNVSTKPKTLAQTKNKVEIKEMKSEVDYGSILGPIIGVIILNILITVIVVLLGLYCLTTKRGGSKYKRFGNEKDDNPTFNCATLEFSNPMKDATV